MTTEIGKFDPGIAEEFLRFAEGRIGHSALPVPEDRASFPFNPGQS